MTAVLNASALLALLFREQGADFVVEALEDAVMSTVSWSEVLQRLAQRGTRSNASIETALGALGLRLEPFGQVDAVLTAALWERGRVVGLSLGDRACLALAGRLDAVALTADRDWAGLDIGIKVRLVR